jgi:chromosome partitioning protein
MVAFNNGAGSDMQMIKDEQDQKPAAVPRKTVTLAALSELTTKVETAYETLKGQMTSPYQGKQAPTFSGAKLAELCKKPASSMLKLLERAEELGLASGNKQSSDGESKGKSTRRSFTLAEAMEWVRYVNPPGLRYQRKPGQKGAVIATGFFKGGVGKTNITVSLAQGLALTGAKVLVIDLDPQGNATSMLGVDPNSVDLEQTFAPLTWPEEDEGHRDSIVESIRPTYWSGVDVVAASTGLFIGEFYLPMRAMNAAKHSKVFRFMEVLKKALDMGVTSEYDYVLIDTPPSISYVTMNAYWAADGILVPMVPEGLSLQSSVQFFSLFNELAESAEKSAGKPKEWGWVGVVANMVEVHVASSNEMLQWVRAFFGTHVLATVIPRTEAVRTGGMTNQTIYDMTSYIGSQRTYERAKEAFDALVTEVDAMTRKHVWQEGAEGKQ